MEIIILPKMVESIEIAVKSPMEKMGDMSSLHQREKREDRMEVLDESA